MTDHRRIKSAHALYFLVCLGILLCQAGQDLSSTPQYPYDVEENLYPLFQDASDNAEEAYPLGRPATTPSEHGVMASGARQSHASIANPAPEYLRTEEVAYDQHQTAPMIPPAQIWGHAGAVYSGSESDIPIMPEACHDCEGAKTAPLLALITPATTTANPPATDTKSSTTESAPASLLDSEPSGISRDQAAPPESASATLRQAPRRELRGRFDTESTRVMPEEPPASNRPTPQVLPQEPKPQIPERSGQQDTIAPAPKASSSPRSYLINFQNVLMNEYVKFVGQLSGKNFIYNSDDLQFTVTIVSKEPTTLDNIMAALLQELRIHGLGMLEQGNNLIIYKQAGVVSPASLFSEDVHPQEIITRVFRIEHVGADKISEIITRMLSDQALVQTLADSNTLIVTDLSTNVERISQIIRVLDLPSQTFEIGQYVAVNTLIADLIPMAQQILTPLSSGRPPVLVPQPKTNTIFIVASPEMAKQAISVLRKLDVPSGSTEVMTVEELQRAAGNLRPGITPTGEAMQAQISRTHFQHPSEIHTKFYIHKLQFRQGDQIQDALYRIADSLRLDEQANIDLINAINSTQWLEASNALVITGTEEAVGRVKELVEELDIALRQVLLEMLILDTTIDDSLAYSVDVGDQFSSQFVGSALAVNTPNVNGSNVFPFPIDQTAAGTIVPSLVHPPTDILQNPGFNLGIIGRKIFKGDNAFTTIGALVRAAHHDEDAEIVLNPKILVEDNFPAEVFVGQNTPYATQSVVNQNSNFVTQNVEYRDVGTTLKVTPQLGNGDIITLTIEEEVSEIVSFASTTGGLTSPLIAPTTNKSNTITKVHVPDGYFVILSGVIRCKTDRIRDQVPCLGGVPILGALVSSKRDIIQKRNILIFIRPQIIDENCKYHDATRHNQNIYKEKNRRKPRWKYETDEALDFLNLPRFDCGCPPPDADRGGGGW